MLKTIAILLLVSFSGSALSNTCTIPRETDIPPNYDWLRENETNQCLRQVTKTATDYYMLLLSYSPNFCAKVKANGKIKPEHQFQCSGDNSFHWIAHGLWAQSSYPAKCKDQNGKTFYLHPRYCAGDTVSQIPADTIRKYMCTQPGALLLQAEWEKHGTCGDFARAEQYFQKTQELFNALILPDENLKPPKVFRWVKKHNDKLKNVRIGYNSGEIRICYDKSWNYIDCPKH